ncbi:ribbon-helix-helix protein, CopG family [Roseburia inulinivorans]|nr:ribbon-helix-helix domain-containing protein [bacterium]MDY3039271.1 ribbon-helix-helix protein, CopG family [Roseburia inulinivorans]
MKPLKSKVSITLDSDMIAQLKELAENDDRSFSQFINMILKEYLNQKNKEA